MQVHTKLQRFLSCCVVAVDVAKAVVATLQFSHKTLSNSVRIFFFQISFSLNSDLGRLKLLRYMLETNLDQCY